MAYSATGTAGNDNLNQSGDTGPGTIVGLAGDDSLSLGTGLATVTGDSGNDSVLLQTGNTGTVNGGTENDSIFGPAGTGSMQLFGSDGADTVDVQSTGAQTVVGGNDSNDGADTIITGGGADLIYGNGGNDTINSAGGNDTLVSGFGNDSVAGGAGNEQFFGNQGNDTVDLAAGADTGWGGQGNDSLLWTGAGSPVLFGNEGGDTLAANGGTPTLVGGNDSADGNDLLIGAGTVTAFALGNGGNDTFNIGSTGGVTEVGGFGNDCMFFGNGAEHSLLFGNEGNDVIEAFAGLTGATTVFAGQGNDSVITAAGRDTIQGNEGNDTIQGDAAGGISIDTISGGTGNDVFAYLGALNGGQDGNNAVGGGPVEQITDLDWSADKFDTQLNVTFAANMGAGTGANLNAAATNALAAAFALGGSGGAQVTAAQFTFSGRTYVVIEQTTAGTAVFDDATDLLLDITGATGTIATSNFI
jgi:Ca2+-binding RTX toxin-like protein